MSARETGAVVADADEIPDLLIEQLKDFPRAQRLLHAAQKALSAHTDTTPTPLS